MCSSVEKKTILEHCDYAVHSPWTVTMHCIVPRGRIGLLRLDTVQCVVQGGKPKKDQL